jgi:hypothetical protein
LASLGSRHLGKEFTAARITKPWEFLTTAPKVAKQVLGSKEASILNFKLPTSGAVHQQLSVLVTTWLEIALVVSGIRIAFLSFFIWDRIVAGLAFRVSR